MESIGKVFKAMADATRREILEMLREADRSAGEISDRFSLTKPAISHHLSVLKEAGLETERREGQHIIYSLREDSIVEAIDGFPSKLCRDKAERRANQRASRTAGKGGKRRSRDA
jgi:DNA-binding transcriptional ArsR family regulator